MYESFLKKAPLCHTSKRFCFDLVPIFTIRVIDKKSASDRSYIMEINFTNFEFIFFNGTFTLPVTKFSIFLKILVIILLSYCILLHKLKKIDDSVMFTLTKL